MKLLKGCQLIVSVLDPASSTSQITTTVSQFNVSEAQILISSFHLSVLHSNSTICTYNGYVIYL